MVEQAIAVVEACHFKPLFPGGPPMRVAYHHLKKPLTGQEQEQYLPSTVLFVGGIRRKTTGDLRDIFARWKPVSARIGTQTSVLRVLRVEDSRDHTLALVFHSH